LPDLSWTKLTQTGKNIPDNNKLYQMATNYTKWQLNIPNGHKYANILHILQGPPKLTKIGIFGLKINHLATLLPTQQTQKQSPWAN
jgi:hypothetical protein